ncbi:MAG: FemAB family PEP-CTERM system-associated protein [Planctomycetales bacterium]|nr:FemAB family PEP-CTERM system-associated protein [Planctomycetales bacterium]
MHDTVEILSDSGCFGAANEFDRSKNLAGAARDLSWLRAVCDGLRLRPFRICVRRAGRTIGDLPLAFMSSRLFGRFLVGLPYVNSGGIAANEPEIADKLIEEAVRLADRLDVRFLELRHEREVPNARLGHKQTQKVHMRLSLPGTVEELWKTFHPKVRNQIRKGEKNGFRISWGTGDLLDAFYDVFARNMRDLGTPVYSRRLFRTILEVFQDDAELCLLYDGDRAIAGALLVHGPSATEVPSASSLRAYNASCANMLMYWQLLQRSVQRHQGVFDFGRSSAASNTYRFKKQWGAQPHPAVWQYYLRQGALDQMRPDSPKYRRKIWVWQHLPVWLTRLTGPHIVRGIP